jgi:hypothetical protein
LSLKRYQKRNRELEKCNIGYQKRSDLGAGEGLLGDARDFLPGARQVAVETPVNAGVWQVFEMMGKAGFVQPLEVPLSSRNT